jgi:predicted PurR-regulated permease PerM
VQLEWDEWMANMHHEDGVSRAFDVSINVGLFILLAATCFFILRPFLPLILWGIIIAIAAHPGYRRVKNLLGGRRTLAAVVSTVFLFALLILPVILLTGSLVDGIQSLAGRLKEGTPIIPPPPPRIATWPIVGVPLNNGWALASNNLAAVLQNYAPQIKAIIPKLLLISAGIGLTVLQGVLSILVSGFLLANAEGGAKVAYSLANRLFRDKGSEYAELAAATIRSVTTGIIGVALIQTVFAAIGFLVVGMPAAGLWGMIFLFAAVLQLGVVVLVPALIYVFAIASTTKAMIFLVWCVIVGTMDNVLKPLLLGRGVAVPMVVVFLGVVGGFAAMGAIGLFLDAIVLAVGYKLFLAWLEDSVHNSPVMSERSVSAGTVS